MRLLIVDDEIIIRNGLSRVIDWESIDIEVLPPAASAEEALERVHEERPHIILTDIRMTGMSGLEMTKLLKNKYPDTEVVILSGYDEFAYAQQAIREGVSDYLLKTSRPDDIIRTVLAAKERIRDKWDAQRRGTLHHVAFRNQMMEQLITEGIEQEPLLSQAMKLLQLDGSRHDSYQVMLLTGSGWSEEGLLLFSIDNMLREMLDCETLLRQDHLVVMLRYEEKHLDTTAIRSVIERLERQLKCSIFAALGLQVSHVSALKQSYREAAHTFTYRHLIGGKGILHMDDIRQRKGGRTVCSREEEAELAAMLIGGKQEELRGWIESKMERERQDGDTTPGSYAAYLNSMMISAYRWLERVISAAKPSKIPHDLRPQEISATTLHPEEAVFQGCCLIMGIYREFVAEDRFSYIQRSIAYIKDHLHTNITLQQVAKFVHLNPNHFSEVFKRETGVNYIEFVTRERMQRAMEILNESEVKISQVAGAVGYEDMKYFSQLFKKYTGKTPSEYRQKN